MICKKVPTGYCIEATSLRPCPIVIVTKRDGSVILIFEKRGHRAERERGGQNRKLNELAMQSFIDKSKPILQKAVALDRDNKKDEAVESYAEGITLLLEAMSCNDSTDSVKEALRNKISKYLARAEVLRGQIKPEVLSVDQIHIKHNDTGFGYERIFKRCADNELTEINVRDAYIMLPYQVLNFVRFCELFVLHAPNLKVIYLWTRYDTRADGLLQQLKGSLSCRNIELNVCYDENFHDREIRQALFESD
uniref:MIT domain-containing protein n=1 Tax=Setaria digitata TaxID=48799 RepID=A0A915Q8D3_9BILA